MPGWVSTSMMASRRRSSAGDARQALSSQPEPYTPTLVKTGLPRGMVSGGAFHPPKDYVKWQQLIEAWARHSAERYGAERASSWLWEPWNEPESPYWGGTPEEFFALYDHFAAGVKRALPGARVGGPHVTDPAWKNGDVFMRAFLEHCRSGRNAATGEIGAPLDFIAFHAKGTNTAWLSTGSPQPPNPEQAAELHAAAEMRSQRHALTVDAGGMARLEVALSRQSVKLIEVLLR